MRYYLKYMSSVSIYIYNTQLFLKMIFNKINSQQKKGDSSRKVHRRVITEIEEPHHPFSYKIDLKKSEKINSKPKFIDVYSKYLAKQTNYPKRNFKINLNKPVGTDKHLRTQPDEVFKTNISVSQKPKTTSFLSKYEIEGVAGKGTFGVVYFGVNRSTGEKIAIKKVFQDKKYKNRQHQILKLLKHPNNLVMKDSFLTTEGEQEYLNIVMDYYSDNLYQVIKKKDLNPLLVKIYIYQVFRGLNYLNMLSIAHRDIKPQNILVDRVKHTVIISDFGSAKQLVKTQANLAYICSRCYRAPQLIFGATDYTTQIDVWSTGCVLVEMINGSPPFMGDSQVDQLIEIIKIIGTPTKQEVEEMNKLYDMKQYTKFPKIKTTPWSQLLNTKDPLLLDLVTKVLKYSPLKRIKPSEALMHEYFNQLRDQARYQQILYRVKTIPELFDYSKEQLNFIYEQTKRKFDLVPLWALKKAPIMNLTTNKVTSSSTNTKRSIISFKAI